MVVMKVLNFCIILHFFSSFYLSAFFEKINFLQKHKAIKAYELKDYETAFAYFNNLIAQDPYNPEYNYNLGTIFYKQKKYKDAQNSFVRAAEYADVHSLLQEQAFFNAGNSFYQSEDWQQAVNFYQKVLVIDKDNQSAQHNLQLALSQLQKEQKSADTSEKDNQDNQQNRSTDKDEQKNQDYQEKSDNTDKKNQKNRSENSNKQKSDQNHNSEDEKSGDENLNTDEQNNSQKNQQSHEAKSSDSNKLDFDKKKCEDKNNLDHLSDQQDDLIEDTMHVSQEDEDKQNQDKQEEQSKAKNYQEFQDTLKKEYEKKASDDERLEGRYVEVMQDLEKLEEYVQKHMIKNKVAMEKEVNSNGKNW